VKASENRFRSGVFEPNSEKVTGVEGNYHEELQNIHFSPNTARVIKSRRTNSRNKKYDTFILNFSGKTPKGRDELRKPRRRRKELSVLIKSQLYKFRI
jgi:hypothetical protein